MASIEELLAAVIELFTSVLYRVTSPSEIICGYKEDISAGVGQRLIEKATPIHRVVVVSVRSLGTGTYISFGNEAEQSRRLTAVGSSLDIDFVDDLSKVVVNTDTGTTGAVDWIGG